ncbi:MAG: hypothetical protein ACR2JH_02005 [Solirubrobacteraceae bacterium]
MNFMPKRKLITTIAVLATAAAAGGAYAATQTATTSPRQALLNDVAKRLNVTPQKLREAFQGAFFDQLNAAVAAGKLTQAQADKIKQRVQRRGGAPGWFGRPRLGFRGMEHGFLAPGPGRGGRFKAAAGYLGLSRKQLFDQLAGGKSLAQVAQARGKSVSGLKSAMLAAIHARLDRAVTSKLTTAAQEQQFLSRLPARLDAEINRSGFPFHGYGFRLHGAGGAYRMAPHGAPGVPMPPPPGPAGLPSPPPGAPAPAPD